jgi:predicted O-linked N-acetylglucosamine transferase (SPINDLY family)
MAEAQPRWNRRFADPLRQKIQPHRNDRDPGRRLRVGYVSSDLRVHVVGRNLVPLFRHHDTAQFEILCYSGSRQTDCVTEIIRPRASAWRMTAGMNDDALAAMIREDQVDILVDLTQHMGSNRLLTFARQPAPVQVSFAGYPESTGLETIAYRLSDRWLEGAGEERTDGKGQGADRRWQMEDDKAQMVSPRERVFLLDSFWCYDPCGMEVPVNALPAREGGIVTFGSMNNFCKVNEPLLRLWARVLAAVPGSQLVLLCRHGSHRQRTLQFLEREGIAMRRVRFADPGPRQSYLELYHQLDVVLDTFPYNGHTTSLDALWMGVPVVSLAGKPAVSRAGWSQLSNLGLADLVARTEDQYVAIARALAGDLPRLEQLRATLRSRMEDSVLMDGPRFARQIEDAYRAMWRQWCR